MWLDLWIKIKNHQYHLKPKVETVCEKKLRVGYTYVRTYVHDNIETSESSNRTVSISYWTVRYNCTGTNCFNTLLINYESFFFFKHIRYVWFHYSHSFFIYDFYLIFLSLFHRNERFLCWHEQIIFAYKYFTSIRYEIANLVDQVISNF